MADFELSEDQIRAATTLNGSVMVASAAGSGKTAVLARRCAYLACEAPAGQRCDITSLAVLTFTEAAAAQMRQRIREVILTRHGGRDGRRQLLLLDDAHISTIHAFCLWLLRQQFNAGGLDPQARVLDAPQAGLLLHESTHTVLRDWRASGPQARRLRTLLAHHFRNQEQLLAGELVRLYEFQRCLPGAEAWLRRAEARCRMTAAEAQSLERSALLKELDRHIQAAERAAAALRRSGPAAARHLAAVLTHQDALRQLAGAADASGWDEIVTRVRACAVPAIRSHGGHSPPPAAELIGDLRTAAKQLVRRFGLFSTAQRMAGLASIEPHVATLADLLRAVQAAYAGAKRRMHVLDFNDLEHLAWGLLGGGEGRPSGVARTLQQRFEHVLVDEFQDVNPLQEQILHLISREPDPTRPNNLFCVGDMKQSIYRFRMARPALTARRLRRAQQGEAGFKAVHLPQNFRSQPPLIAGINFIFDRLLATPLSELAYDEQSRLQAAAPPSPRAAPIQAHLILRPGAENKDEAGDAGDDEPDGSAAGDDQPALELQAGLIGSQIRRLVEREGYAHRDIAILLRAATGRAEHMAKVLQNLGIPTAADTTTGFFESREVQDVLALLAVLDNARQDIPLAAVLRSGLIDGLRFDERELLALRQALPDEPFHRCLSRAAGRRLLPELATRARSLRRSMLRFRDLFGLLPLPEALERIMESTQLTARVSGRPGASQRRAGLLALRRQVQAIARSQPGIGLHGFLRFLEQLRLQEQDVGLADPAAEAGDAVRITTVHNSKGLEFPVVFVANLEKPFNLTDSRRAVLCDNEEGLALKVVDPGRRIRYPSLLSARLTDAQRREELAEEMRVLYVALTRARERLILVGATEPAALARARRWTVHAGPLPELALRGARHALDWLLPVVYTAPELFDLHEHPAAGLTTGLPDRRKRPPWVANVAALAALPESFRLDENHPEVRAALRRLDFRYPQQILCTTPAVATVSARARQAAPPGAAGSRRRTPDTGLQALPPRPRFLRDSAALTPAERGAATHVFLQHLDYARADELAGQLATLVDRGQLSPAEAAAVDLAAIAWYLDTALGRQVRSAAGTIRRELSFLARAPAAPGAAEEEKNGRTGDDFVVLRGMVDLLLPVGDGFDVIDFKTDDLTPGEVADVLPVYAEQVRQYAVAVARIWDRPVSGGTVVFLGPRRIERIPFSQDHEHGAA
jgi:ATP-dependent helicase/nuclease subunit A